VPFKANQDRRHHIPKQRHRVANWPAYDIALRQRESLTVWFTEAAIAAWKAGPLGVLFGNRRDARHAAMAPFATQSPQEPALQQRGVEPVGLRPTMLPRYGDTRGMDHMRLDPARIQPTRQP